MSWLVAPQWTQAAAERGTAARRAATSGMTGLPSGRAARPRATGSNRLAWQAAAIVSAASPGITPQSASAPARAASASSMAWSQATSPVAARTSSVEKIGAKSRSPVKEHRLVIALQADVEAQPGGIGAGHEGGDPIGLGDRLAERGPTALARASSGK